jgi:uncharacterized protein YlxW (UPF0749 family)
MTKNDKGIKELDGLEKKEKQLRNQIDNYKEKIKVEKTVAKKKQIKENLQTIKNELKSILKDKEKIKELEEIEVYVAQ